jgi:riboflavin synthase
VVTVFTGIVAERGRVEAIEAGDGGARVRIRAELASEMSVGDSVAVNGTCLTATTAAGSEFTADVMQQTLGLTTLGRLGTGDPVNLELALRADDRLGGHIVQGHVDGTATLASSVNEGFARRLRFEAGPDLLAYVVEHGSIAIEGVSLTVAGLGDGWLEVSLIPETLERTTLGELSEGDSVNIECDVLARYVQRFIEKPSARMEAD